MAIQLSLRVRNAILDTREATTGTSARLQIRSGAPPANCAAAAAGVLLLEYQLVSDWAAAATGGTKTFAGITPANAVASGTMGHYRIVDSGATQCDEQGTIGIAGSGADVICDNPGVLAGQQISVSSWVLTAPGA